MNLRFALAPVVLGALSGSAIGQTTFSLTTVASGLSRPVYVTQAPGDVNRLFIVEQRGNGGVASRGAIRIVQNGVLLATPYFTQTVSTASEQGLLGLAFHPNFATNRLLYVSYTNSGGSSEVWEYQQNSPPNANSVNVASGRRILTFAQPFNNHNGGWIGFGPDGFLYFASGDGGSGNDPGNRAQALTNGAATQFLGKMLRLNTTGDDFPADGNRNYRIPASNPFASPGGVFNPATAGAEIWAYGLRNPWRCSFDKLTGDLWIADVGQVDKEEVNIQIAGVGGLNYGWRCQEGFRCTGLSGCTCNGAGLTLPLFEYDHFTALSPTFQTGCSITGGYVYRGPVSWAHGLYFYSDFCGGWINTFDSTQGGAHRDTGLLGGNVASFGEDNAGNLYVVSLGGTVSRINLGCAADYNQDGNFDQEDLSGFITAFLAEPPAPGTPGFDYGQPCTNNPAPYQTGYAADFNRDCNFDQEDLTGYITSFFIGCR